MADRYFQCVMCKKLTVLDDLQCVITNKNIVEPKNFAVSSENLDNEVCDCAGTLAKRRLRELNQSQYDNEVALDRPVNQ